MNMNIGSWLTRTKKGQIGSATSIAWAIGYACIIFVVMAYVIATLSSSLGSSGLTTVAFNNTVANTSGILTQLAPLLLPVGIIAMVAIVLLVLRVAFGGQGAGSQRGGM
jgi:putative exporter of polyketide antibiotics